MTETQRTNSSIQLRIICSVCHEFLTTVENYYCGHITLAVRPCEHCTKPEPPTIHTKWAVLKQHDRRTVVEYNPDDVPLFEDYAGWDIMAMDFDFKAEALQWLMYKSKEDGGYLV